MRRRDQRRRRRAPGPGPPLRFGITPGVQTGQLGTGPPPPRTPEEPRAASSPRSRACARPARRSCCACTASSGRRARTGVRRFLELADRYTRAGYLVELQLRYHPSARAGGRHRRLDRPRARGRPALRRRTRAWWRSRSRTRSTSRSRRTPRTAPTTARRDALVQGVIAAKDEARRRGYDQLEIGFNWAYRYDPQQRALVLGLPARQRRPAVRRRARLGRPRRLPGHVLPAGRHARRRARRHA